ncbi:PREDICTED: uncharacterized protein LOC109476780 [Branchiostoma belcheri]|uniref:Uncharacterized protein LOC109476780 n=1 Tax=Branchiostoma belcheri TaxID=7741 RepID=A0A6P4Z9L3_BRABE|nr:PREDICTED: uncharacterized protein LOC109476780 [Branchiostoma belcheri]
MSVIGVTGTKENQKEAGGRGNEAFVDDEDILVSASTEQTDTSVISKQRHKRKDTNTSYQAADQSSEVTDVKVTVIDESDKSPDKEVDDTTHQGDTSQRSDDQSNVTSKTEKTTDHHDAGEEGDQQSHNTDTSCGPTADNRDPENGQKSSETPGLEKRFATHIIAVICLLLCISACIVDIVKIFLSVSCLWGLSPDVGDRNFTVHAKRNKNVTCDPYESQENIPYNLIDLLLSLQPIVVIVLWKYGDIAARIDKYEKKRLNKKAKKEQYYRRRRTGYFVMITISLFFLLHCIECATCSFSSSTIFFGTLVRAIPKKFCPWLSLLFHLVFPAYCLYCWYATKMACVLRRRADYIQKFIGERSSTIFDKHVRHPDVILSELNDNIFHDDWHSEVWENISFLMNIMMFFSATLVLLYTHVYVSEVRLTLGEWATHFMRLVAIATLSVTPYIHVAFACVRVTEAYSYITESMSSAFQESYSPHSVQESHENSLDISQEPDIEIHSPRTRKKSGDGQKMLERLEYLIQWQFLQSKVYKKCKDGLTSGILGTSYTTRSGVHLAALGVIFAMTWEVLDRFNDFDVERAMALGNTRQEAFIVTLFGVLAFLLWISVLSILLCYRLKPKMCDCTKCTCLAPHAVYRRLGLCILLTILYFVIMYVSFYLVVYQDNYCSSSSNPLFT